MVLLYSTKVCAFTAQQHRWLMHVPLRKDAVNGLPLAISAMHESSRVDMIPGCFKDTRTDVFSDIAEWIEGNDSKRVFWLDGMAGIGKTAIARTIVEHYKRNEEILQIGRAHV